MWALHPLLLTEAAAEGDFEKVKRLKDPTVNQKDAYIDVDKFDAMRTAV